MVVVLCLATGSQRLQLRIAEVKEVLLRVDNRQLKIIVAMAVQIGQFDSRQIAENSKYFRIKRFSILGYTPEINVVV